jgi:hypothetical protein
MIKERINMKHTRMGNRNPMLSMVGSHWYEPKILRHSKEEWVLFLTMAICDYPSRE